MKEPSVSVQMIVDTTPNVSIAVSGQNIAGGVIIADCGTLEPKMFYSSAEVLKEFTKSGRITRTTDTTLIHAAAIADVMPVVLKRSFDDDGTRAGFGIYNNAIDFNDNLNISVIDPSLDNDDQAKLIAGEDIEINGAKISASDFGSTPYSTGENGGISAKNFKITSPRSFNNVKLIIENQFTLANFNYAYVLDEVGEENYIPLSDVEYSSDTGSLSIKTGEYESGNSIVLVFTAATTISEFDLIDKSFITYEECYFKNGNLLKYKQDMTFTSNYITTFNPMRFCIGIDKCYYYNEITGDPQITSYTGIALEGITKDSSIRNVIDAINKQLKNGYVDFDGTNFKVYSEVQYSTISTVTGIDNTTGASTSIINPSGNGISFELIAKYPSSVDFSAKVGPNPEDSNLIDVTVITANRTYEYSGSTDNEYVNAYGANQFIENINDYQGIPFEVHVIPNQSGEIPSSSSILQTPSIAFGKMNIGLGVDLSTRKAALESLVEKEIAKIAFLCPFGYPNNGYLQKLASYNTKIWAFTPVGLYVDKDDAEMIIANRPALSTEYAIMLAPHDKSTLMTDWVTDMSLEVAYLTKVTSNAAKSCEFAPMMGKDNSTLQVTKPSVVFSRTTRERLLDARIMSLITRDSEGISFLNKNQCTGGNTILAEDQNARLACKINRDLDILLEPVIGKYNTDEMRDRVDRMIKTYFENNILNQVYSIDSYTVTCDETNNPPEIRANNQLVVDLSVTYLNAIYEVLVYHRALDVASNNQ